MTVLFLVNWTVCPSWHTPTTESRRWEINGTCRARSSLTTSVPGRLKFGYFFTICSHYGAKTGFNRGTAIFLALWQYFNLHYHVPSCTRVQVEGLPAVHRIVVLRLALGKNSNHCPVKVVELMSTTAIVRHPHTLLAGLLEVLLVLATLCSRSSCYITNNQFHWSPFLFFSLLLEEATYVLSIYRTITLFVPFWNYTSVAI